MSTKPLVVLVGPPAAGKSRVAKRLGRIFDVAVIDTDTVVSSRWGPIPEVFETQGEQFFREKERVAVEEALRTSGVVSLGGGAVLNPDTRRDLDEHRVALITIDAESVAGRLDNDKRPLLKGGLDSWKELVASRQEFYAAVANREFDASRRTVDSLTEDIASWIREDAGL